MNPEKKNAVMSSTIYSRIHLSLFITILITIIAMGILQYHNTGKRLESRYKNTFAQSAHSLNTEIEALENYINRLNLIAKQSYEVPRSFQYYEQINRESQQIMNYVASHKYHQLTVDSILRGNRISGTICGRNTVQIDDKDYAQKVQMALEILPSQKAMHATTPAVTLSYFISKSHDFTQIYPEIPIPTLLEEYPDFEAFQKAAYKVYSDIGLPLDINGTNLFWTKPYIDKAGNGMMVTCGTQLYANELFHGIIGADIVLEFLNKYTDETEDMPGHLYLVTSDGLIISQSGKQYSENDTAENINSELRAAITAVESGSHTPLPHSVIIRLNNAPWYYIYSVDQNKLRSTTRSEMELITALIILLIILLFLAYFYIYHHFILPSSLNEQKIIALNQTLDSKVHERTKELQDREENLKLTLNSIGDAVVVTDGMEKITRMNPVAERLMGCSLSEVRGRKLSLIFQTRDARTDMNLLSPLAHILDGAPPKTKTGETILTATDGTEYHISESSAPIRNSSGDIVGAILVFRDISEEFQMQRNLHNLRNYLSNIIDSMPSSIIGINVHGKVTQWNKTIATTTHITADEAKGQKIEDIIPAITELLPAIEESIFSKKIYTESNTGHFASIGIIHEEFTIYPLSGNTIQQGAVIRIDDISEKVTLENQLLQSRKMDAIGQLSGGIAHDFNNMLNGILVSAEMLQLDHPDADAETRTNIDIILQAALQASELSKKLLTFSRKQKIRKSSLDLFSLLEETHTILSRTIDKKIHITLEQTAEETMVFGDTSALQNVFINLGINASHAMPDGGTLTFKLYNKLLTSKSSHNREFLLRPGRYVAVDVIDTGVGIKEENLEKIFEPFFTTKDKGKGTGLGLSATYGTLKDHNGSITVSSIINSGTTFSILLPSATVSTPQKESIEQLHEGSGTILLVDDEAFIQRTTGKMLEKLGYKVMIASNGIEALEIYQKNVREINCVLMDIIMPEMDGRDTFLKLIEINPACKVILSSGFTKNEHLTDLFNKGLWKFLPKPYRSYELADILQEL